MKRRRVAGLPALLLLAPAALGQVRAAAAPPAGVVVDRPLAGRALERAPWFTPVLSFNEGTPVHAAVDTSRAPALAGSKACLWVVHHRSPAAWRASRSLADARGAPQDVALAPGGVAANVFALDAGTLGAGPDAPTGVSAGYDVVLDRDRDGRLGPGDWIDGWGDTAGFYVVSDLTRPGPYTSVEELFSGSGTFQRLDVYWPAEIAGLGALPLVIVSHGNGHNYRWYDHIGTFLASWGYVVVSHANNTGPGVNQASATTLSNVELFLANLDAIGGGALVGHVDSHRMAWIGHSRGGEGVVRAYQRLLAGDPLATRYTPSDVRLISSIAPTDFLRTGPGDVPYHLWTGGADKDVNGCADCDICQTFHLHERAQGPRFSVSLHGVGHGDFHDGGGSSVAQGPCKVGRASTHQIMRGVLRALFGHALERDPACEEYLWRQWEDLRPIGAPDSPCVVVDLQFEAGPDAGRLMVDDFQSEPDPGVSSSGGRVRTSAATLVEGVLNDASNSFTPDAADPMNGMTLAGPGDDSRGAVLEWDRSDEWLLFELAGGPLDLRPWSFVSLRAAQATRDVLTASALGDLTFSVRLWDAEGRSATLSIGAYGGGVEEPYQRGQCGAGNGWANEFETLRLPLGDFAADLHAGAPAGPLDLSAVVAVELLFGPGYGSPEGRLGLDELQFTRS